MELLYVNSHLVMLSTLVTEKGANRRIHSQTGPLAYKNRRRHVDQIVGTSKNQPSHRTRTVTFDVPVTYDIPSVLYCLGRREWIQEPSTHCYRATSKSTAKQKEIGQAKFVIRDVRSEKLHPIRRTSLLPKEKTDFIEPQLLWKQYKVGTILQKTAIFVKISKSGDH